MEKYEINGKLYDVVCLGRHNKGAYWGRTCCTRLYRLLGTDHALTVTSWGNGPDTVSLKKNYFAEARAYGRACREAARWFNLPVEVVLAVTPQKADLLAKFAEKEFWISPQQEHELLACGIDRRKTEIEYILGTSLYGILGINQMGQVNTERIARWLHAIARKAL